MKEGDKILIKATVTRTPKKGHNMIRVSTENTDTPIWISQSEIFDKEKDKWE